MFNKNEKVEVFLQVFFDKPNQFRLTSNDDSNFISESISFLLQENPSFAVLPYKLNGKVLWCALAFDLNQKFEMQEMLKAFVGEKFIDFNEEIKSNTELGRNIVALTPYAFKVVESFEIIRFERVRKALMGMNYLRKKRPAMRSKVPISSESLIRSFKFAIQRNDVKEAYRLFSQIAERSLLGATNQLFLEIQLKAIENEWELIVRKLLPLVLYIKKPKIITNILLKALYVHEFLEFEKKNGVEEAISHFKNEVYPKAVPLFQYLFHSKEPEVLNIHLLKYLSDHQNGVRPNRNRDIPRESLNAFGQALLDRVQFSSVRPNEAHQSMQEAFKKGDTNAAISYAIYSPDSLEKAIVLFKCFYYTSDIKIHNLYVETINALSEDDRKKLEEELFHVPKIQNFEKSDSALDKKKLPETWVDLIERINNEDISQKSANEVAENISSDWSLQEFLKEGDSAKHLCEKLEQTRSKNADRILQGVLPELIACFRESGETHSSLQPVYLLLLEILALAESLNRSELFTISDLIDLAFSQGLSSARYADILGEVIEILNNYGSPETVDCCMEILEVIFFHPIRDKSSAISIVCAFRNKLEQISMLKNVDDDVELFNKLCFYINQKENRLPLSNACNSDRESIWQAFSEKKIGIYTLTDGVAQRVDEFFDTLNIKAKVEINNDKAGTEALKDIAKKTDIMVVVTKSAKHAATNFIKQHRGDLPIVYPLGKGSSSIIAGLKEYASNL